MRPHGRDKHNLESVRPKGSVRCAVRSQSGSGRSADCSATRWAPSAGFDRATAGGSLGGKRGPRSEG